MANGRQLECAVTVAAKSFSRDKMKNPLAQTQKRKSRNMRNNRLQKPGKNTKRSIAQHGVILFWPRPTTLPFVRLARKHERLQSFRQETLRLRRRYSL